MNKETRVTLGLLTAFGAAVAAGAVLKGQPGPKEALVVADDASSQASTLEDPRDRIEYDRRSFVRRVSELLEREGFECGNLKNEAISCYSSGSGEWVRVLFSDNNPYDPDPLLK